MCAQSPAPLSPQSSARICAARAVSSGARGSPPSSSCLFALAFDSVMTAAIASANRRASASTKESEAVDREDHADAAQETEGEAHAEADASPHRARCSVGVHLR